MTPAKHLNYHSVFLLQCLPFFPSQPNPLDSKARKPRLIHLLCTPSFLSRRQQRFFSPFLHPPDSPFKSVCRFFFYIQSNCATTKRVPRMASRNVTAMRKGDRDSKIVFKVNSHDGYGNPSGKPSNHTSRTWIWYAAHFLFSDQDHMV